ncbi:MAG: GntR family transcriptional regulator [Pseudomonadota bacterium]
MTIDRMRPFGYSVSAAELLNGPLTLSEKARRDLTRMIERREFRSGQPIVEAQLAHRLGISRTPLRQALQRLESEGLLRKHEGRSYVVRRVDLKEYLQSLKVREILEAEAATLSIGRIDPADLARVRRHLHAVQEREPYDMLAHWMSDDEVHDLYIGQCGNDVLLGLLQSLRVTTKLFEVERLAERLKPDSQQHEAILDALEAGDAEAARRAIVFHLKSLAEFAISVL